jgi:hypothetical protein
MTIADAAPTEATVTDYDRTHFPVYLRLLNAAEEGASWQEAARIVLGIDPVADAARAQRAHESHLARARWLSAQGYRELLRTRTS